MLNADALLAAEIVGEAYRRSSPALILHLTIALHQDDVTIATIDYGTTRNQNRTDGAKHGAAPPINARSLAADCHP